MTREEQLACLKDRPCDVCKMRTEHGCSSWECVFEQSPDDENSNREQEPVLDKIRADVINIADNRRSISVRSVIKIIDKYTAESEDKDADSN